MRILVVDNHDSFVYNIVQILETAADCVVKDRSDVTVSDAATCDGILLSPGPGHPADAGVCPDLVQYAADHGTPLLGVCLGHQVIAHHYGATVTHAPEIVHGYTSDVHHDASGVFQGLPSPFRATRYHSLAVEPATVPPCLAVTARTPDGVIMGLRHRVHPVEGVQFHPESVLSVGGPALLHNWLQGCEQHKHGQTPRQEKFQLKSVTS